MPFDHAQPAAGALLAKARVLDSHPQEFHLIETMRHEAGRGLRSLDTYLAGWGRRLRTLGSEFDAAARSALALQLAGAGNARVRLSCIRDGTLGIHVEELREPAAGPVRLAIDRTPVGTPALRLLEAPPELTPREREIAQLAARGHSSKAIAAQLVISVRTVDNALHEVYSKLSINRRADLAPILGQPPAHPSNTKTSDPTPE